ncbi:hypothetical protein ACFE04_011662 [Oxalis oulophora]
MRKLVMIPLLFITTLIFFAIYKVESTPTNFIKSSCRVTRYPTLCVNSLSAYSSLIKQSNQQLTQTALTVSLTRSNSASSFISKLVKVKGLKPKEYRALKDCVENMSDSVDRLNQSVKEFNQLRRATRQEFVWHMSNVQTWVSAALTDDDTCLDGFAGRSMNGNVKNAVRKRVVDVFQVTSNALALVNRYASTHKP